MGACISRISILCSWHQVPGWLCSRVFWLGNEVLKGDRSDFPASHLCDPLSWLAWGQHSSKSSMLWRRNSLIGRCFPGSVCLLKNIAGPLQQDVRLLASLHTLSSMNIHALGCLSPYSFCQSDPVHQRGYKGPCYGHLALPTPAKPPEIELVAESKQELQFPLWSLL